MTPTRTAILCTLSFAAGCATFMLAAYYWLERSLPHQR